MGELLFTAALLAVFAIFFNGVGAIHTTRSVDPIGPVPVPEMVILIGALLCLVILVLQARKLMQGKVERGMTISIKVISLLVLIVAFLVLLDRVGFFMSALVLFFALSRLTGNTSLPRNLLTSFLACAAFTVLFGKVLSVPLPRGEGVFRVLSHWIF